MNQRMPAPTIRTRRGVPKHAVVSVLAAAVLALAGTPGVLQASNKALPKGDKVLDDYAKAIGGKNAHAKLQNRVTKGTLEMVGMSIKGVITSYYARPNKHVSILESDVFGQVLSGTDGDVAWEISAMKGPSLKTGAERALLLREAIFDAPVHWRKLYTKAECVGTEAVDETPCYKVIATPKEGKPETRYYDEESHLLVKTEMTIESAMGDIPVETYFSDYKQVDGVLVAHKAKSVIGGMQQMLIVIESVEHGVEIPADRFDLPPEIKALVEKDADKPKGGTEKEDKGR